MKRPKIHILVCSLETVPFEWAHKVWGPLAYLGCKEFDKVCSVCRGNYSIDAKRNYLVEKALEDKDMTHVLFLDNDEVPEDKDIHSLILSLLKNDLPIVSGLAKAKIAKFPFPFMAFLETRADKERGFDAIATIKAEDIAKFPIFEVDAVGCGFVLIKREVFEKLPKPWFKSGVENGDFFTEDIFFCENAKKAGIKMYIDSTVKLGHIGSFKLHTDGQITTH